MTVARRTVVEITDDDVSELVKRERAVLFVTRSDCESCRRYENEIAAAADAGELDGVPVGKVLLNQPGCLQFKKDNPWLRTLTHLPFTLIYERGKTVDAFATSKVSYLVERLDRAARNGAAL